MVADYVFSIHFHDARSNGVIRAISEEDSVAVVEMLKRLGYTIDELEIR